MKSWIQRFTVACLLCLASSAHAAAPRPNIILIMSDDVGYSDIGCYGSEIATPHLHGLAHGGVRFTQFYNTARCCPTRASLLTGLYAHQAGIGHMVDGPGPKTGSPAYSGELSRSAVTIAEVLKSAGYATYLAGKWHATQKTTPGGEGGISTPLFAHWAAGITRERAGKLEAQPAHLIDLMPTLLDVAGAKHPAEFKGKPILPVEGRSLMPAFKDQPLPRDTLFWEHESNRAVRQADWKAVAKGRGPWELYDLKTERTETRDLAAQHPDKARELAVLWKAWAERCGVWEWDNLQKHRHSRAKKKNKQ